MKRMMVLIVAAVMVLGFTGLSHATLTAVGTDSFGDLFIYDSVNNVTWYDLVYSDTGTNLKNNPPGVADTGIAGWSLPTITQLTTLSGELRSKPRKLGPFCVIAAAILHRQLCVSDARSRPQLARKREFGYRLH